MEAAEGLLLVMCKGMNGNQNHTGSSGMIALSIYLEQTVLLSSNNMTVNCTRYNKPLSHEPCPAAPSTNREAPSLPGYSCSWPLAKPLILDDQDGQVVERTP